MTEQQQHPLFGKCLCGKDMRWSDHKEMWYCSEHGWFDHDASHSSRSTPVAGAPDKELKDMQTLHEKECFMYGYRTGAKEERERVLCELLAYIHPDSRAGDVIKKMLESLRREGAP